MTVRLLSRGCIIGAVSATVLAATMSGAVVSVAGTDRGQSPAFAAGSFLSGIGDESPAMFTDPLWLQLRMRVARLVVPYDAAVRPYWLARARAWIARAEADHVRVLLAFYHSEETPTTLPSVAVYQRDVQRFVGLFPGVREYESYDEANRGDVPGAFSSPHATLAAGYYRALLSVCSGCTVVGLDVLDAQNIAPTLRYIQAFKRQVHKLGAVMPGVWGLHNYSDVNRFQSWRTRAITRAFGGEVWLTESGGLVQFGRAFPNRHGAGLARAARALRFMFSLARSVSQIRRLYIYNWTGGTSTSRFDAGLTNAHDTPRPGYVAVCRALHAAHCTNLKTARN